MNSATEVTVTTWAGRLASGGRGMTSAGAGAVPATQARCLAMSSTPTTSNASSEPGGSQSVAATPAAAAGRTRIALVAPAPSTASSSVQSYKATSAWLARTTSGPAVSTVKQDAVGSTVAPSVAVSPGCTVACGSLPRPRRPPRPGRWWPR